MIIIIIIIVIGTTFHRSNPYAIEVINQEAPDNIALEKMKSSAIISLNVA